MKESAGPYIEAAAFVRLRVLCVQDPPADAGSTWDEGSPGAGWRSEMGRC